MKLTWEFPVEFLGENPDELEEFPKKLSALLRSVRAGTFMYQKWLWEIILLLSIKIAPTVAPEILLKVVR